MHTAKEGRQREDGSAEEKRFLFIIHIFLLISIYQYIKIFVSGFIGKPYDRELRRREAKQVKGSIHEYFQVGTVQWMSHPARDVLDSIRSICRDDYFDAIEVRHFEDPAQRKAAAKLIREAHITPIYAAQPTLLAEGLNPNDLSEARRLRAERVLCEAVEEAIELGSASMAMMAGHWREESREEAFQQLKKTTVAVCRYAEKKGIQVVLEVFDYDMDRCTLIGPASLAAEFAAEVRKYCANFSLLVDMSHIVTAHETARYVIRALRPYISGFHMANAVVQKGCENYRDKHPRFGFPNSACDVNELKEFLQILREEGFFCREQPCELAFEVKPYGDEDDEMVLAGCKRTLNRAWALLEE